MKKIYNNNNNRWPMKPFFVQWTQEKIIKQGSLGLLAVQNLFKLLDVIIILKQNIICILLGVKYRRLLKILRPLGMLSYWINEPK